MVNQGRRIGGGGNAGVDRSPIRGGGRGCGRGRGERRQLGLKR